MKRKILFSLVFLVLLLGVSIFYLDHRNRTLSPPGQETFSLHDVKLTVDYSRPSKRDRLIFGSEKDGALQPYGKYWRLGANEGTEFESSVPFEVGGKTLEAGRYRIYAVPQEDQFEIYFSNELGSWGYSQPDHANDIHMITVPVTKIGRTVEQFTFKFNGNAWPKVSLMFEWDQVRCSIVMEMLTRNQGEEQY